MKLQLQIIEKIQGDILICGCYPQILGKLEAFTSIDFQLEVFPITCGVASLSGLRIIDLRMDKTYELRRSFATFTVEMGQH